MKMWTELLGCGLVDGIETRLCGCGLDYKDVE